MKKTVTETKSGVYFRSDSNNWGLENEFLVRKNGNLVLKNILIHKGFNDFKIADANWSSNCNYGYCGEAPIMLSHNYVLTNNVNNNINLVAHDDYLVDIYLYHREEGLVMRIVSHKK